MTDSFSETAVRVTQQVSDVNRVMGQRLSDASSEVTSQLDTAGTSMLARIEKTAELLRNRFDNSTGMLERVTDELNTKLDGTGMRFADILDQASGAILADLGKAARMARNTDKPPTPESNTPMAS